MEINWFPGHMAKSRRELQENIKRADLVLEICDARLPLSSRHPDLVGILQKRPVWTILGKADLADPLCTKAWLETAAERKQIWLAMDLFFEPDLKILRSMLQEFNAKSLEEAKTKGKRISPLRIVVAGIPNTGKSTLINRLVGKKTTQTSNKPGVTRKLRWVKGGTDFEVLDTPGILAPKLDTREAKINLAATGAIPDDILPLEEVAFALFTFLLQRYPEMMESRYEVSVQAEDLEYVDNVEYWEIFQQAAIKRNCLSKGGKPDIDRFNKLFLQEFRSARIGRISLEFPANK
ncbi:MAG TPA: ribosome biogenesis GTPase YlqF [Clostridiaceae bacterium]|nr:ribosome biogenesis GTPase YlqF [Clostridiaceae bacterium]